MALPVPLLLPGEMFFDYTVNVLWIGTTSIGNLMISLGSSGITFPILATPGGSHSAPSYSFAGDPTTGFRWVTPSFIVMDSAGVDTATLNPLGIELQKNMQLLWSSTTDPTHAADNSIGRVGAAILAFGNGTLGDFSGELHFTNAAQVADIWGTATHTTANSSLHITAGVTQVGVSSGGSVILAAANSPIITATAGNVLLSGVNINLQFGSSNTGLSKISGGTLGLGNGTAGDVTGQLQLNSLAQMADIWGIGVTQSGANSALHILAGSTQVGTPSGGSIILAAANAAILTASVGLVALTGATVGLQFGNNLGFSRITAGSLALGNGTTGDVSAQLTLGNVVHTVAAPTVAAGQVGIGSTTATTVGAAGGASALPATPVGYLIINVGGTKMKIPYYNN